MIDRKYKFTAIDRSNNIPVHNEEDALVFLAKDKALPATLKKYWKECNKLGCTQSHLDSILGLMDRVDDFQKEHGSKVPDLDKGQEELRVLHGIGL